jgi:5-methylthioadenosine/S-adenosylhomocysteine deaminase
VWVDGKRVVDNYRCITIDEERLYAEVQTAAEAIIERSGLPSSPRWTFT